MACFISILTVFLPVTLLGILFGYMVVRTGSLLTGMVAHSTNNAIAMLISYAVLKAQSQGLPIPDPSTSAAQLHTPTALLSLLPVIGIALLVVILGLRALPHPHPAPEESRQHPENDKTRETETFDEFTESEENLRF